MNTNKIYRFRSAIWM